MDAYAVFVKRFVTFVAVVTVCVCGVTSYLHRLDLPYTDNDFIRQYQFKKLDLATSTDTLIIGDSSAGNAVNAELFSKLTKTNALNIALTGSFGIEGSVMMLEQALKRGLPIKNVLILQTLDIWHRPFSEEGVIDTSGGVSPCVFVELCSKRLSVSRYIFNPNEIVWAYDYYTNGPKPFAIEGDYRKQNQGTLANGGRLLGTPLMALPVTIDQSKIEAIKILGVLCQKNQLNCVYVHGPLVQDIARISTTTLDNVNTIVRQVQGVVLVPELPSYPVSEMGDSIDHIGTPYKAKTTKQYADMFLKSLAR